MIKLKNGFEVKHNKDFDQFFKNLLSAMITESQIDAENIYSTMNKATAPEGDASPNEFFLKMLMDNCIYVTHQLFDIAKTNEDMSKFMVTGFIFNSILLSIPQDSEKKTGENENDMDIIH